MKRLIDDLLSLSRIEMNEHVRPSDEVDLARVAAHARDVLAGMAAEQVARSLLIATIRFPSRAAATNSFRSSRTSPRMRSNMRPPASASN